MADDAWKSGEAYERFMGRWSRRGARAFVPWLEIAAGKRWADVGAGTGALTQGILDLASPAAVTGIEPSAAFLDFARGRVDDPRASFVAGSAEALPLPSGAVEVAASAFVLNFIPDPAAALREMVRVVRPGGTVAALVWDYLEGMEFLLRFWRAAAELDPQLGGLDERARFTLCRPAPLEALFTAADLDEVRVEAIEIETRFADFADYWQPFLGGTGPGPTYLTSLSDDRREALRARLEASLPTGADGAIALRARAWAVAGRVAASS